MQKLEPKRLFSTPSQNRRFIERLPDPSLSPMTPDAQIAPILNESDDEILLVCDGNTNEFVPPSNVETDILITVSGEGPGTLHPDSTYEWQDDSLTDPSYQPPSHSDISKLAMEECVINISTIEELDHRLCLTHLVSLLQLAEMKVPAKCQCVVACDAPLYPEVVTNGTGCIIEWKCKIGHVSRKWWSQPRLKGTNAGDLAFSSATILSGNNFAKVSLLLKFLGGTCHSATAHSRYCGLYIYPGIDDEYQDMEDEILENVKDKPLILAGDGRMDSPGHTATFCTFTLMDHETHEIIHTRTVDRRQTNKVSTRMEAYALEKSLDYLLGKDLNITEVVTDQHSQVTCNMKKRNEARKKDGKPEIKHSYDVWHLAKNISKKLNQAALNKDCKGLQPWISDIVTHFYYCIDNADGDVLKFKARWIGVLHHVTGSHEWIMTEAGIDRCEHDEEFQEKTEQLLVPGSPPHKALQRVVLDRRLMNIVPYFVNFRRTDALENYHQLILKYAAKRFSFIYPAYDARTKLAALDHNRHKDRPFAETKAGKQKHSINHSKRSKHWGSVKKRVDKTYDYIPALQMDILRRRIEDKELASRPVRIAADDPRNLSRNVASIPRPPTEEIIAKQKSRFPKKLE